MSATSSRRYVTVASAIVVVAVVVLAAFFVVIQRGPAASSSLATSTSSGSILSTGEGQCGQKVESAIDAFTLHTAPGSPATLCVAYYYYDTTSTMQLNFNQTLSIFGWPTNRSGQATTFGAGTNFTITSEPGSATIGGPDNLNEGILVTYTITANPGASGTYELNLGGSLLPSMEGCGSELTVVAGSGSPNYMGPSVCITVSSSGGTAPYPEGYIFVYITGATNSTNPG